MAAVHLIKEHLSELHPENADLFEKNAKFYTTELAELHQWIKTQINTVPEPQRILITGHNAFLHYGAAYGLRNLGSLNPNMSTAHISPDPKHLSELASAARQAKVPALFPEVGHSPKLIKALAREAGINVAPALTVGNLGPEQGETGTYLGLMQLNTEIIVTALGGKTAEAHEDHKHDHDHEHDHKH